MKDSHMQVTTRKEVKRETPRNNAYGAIALIALEDKRLSWRAKGVLAYLLTRQDDSPISRDALCATGPDDRIAVHRALRELEERGYLRGGPNRWDVLAVPDAESKASGAK